MLARISTTTIYPHKWSLFSMNYCAELCSLRFDSRLKLSNTFRNMLVFTVRRCHLRPNQPSLENHPLSAFLVAAAFHICRLTSRSVVGRRAMSLRERPIYLIILNGYSGNRMGGRRQAVSGSRKGQLKAF